MRDGGFRSHIYDVLDPYGTAGSPLTVQNGENPGQYREELIPSGTAVFVLVTATAAITVPGCLLKYDPTDSTGCSVKPTAAATDIVAGIAPQSFTQGQSALTQVSIGQSFWMQVGGFAQVMTNNGATAGTEQSASSSGGQGANAPYSSGIQQGTYGTLLVANSSGAAALRGVRLQGLY